jgi:hypothetical protein
LQHWYCYPDLTADEVLLFTGFDSACPGGGRVAHGAFDNRANAPAAIARESVEARFFAFFQ